MTLMGNPDTILHGRVLSATRLQLRTPIELQLDTSPDSPPLVLVPMLVLRAELWPEAGA